MGIGTDVAARLRDAGCVFAEEEARLLLDAAGTPERVAGLVERRLGGEPLETVLGWAGFAGRRLAVEPGVFVPRRRSELLVTQAVARVRPGSVVLDMCCGTGALGACVAAEVAGLELHAVDVDPRAVRCARRNLPPGAVVYLGDLFDPLPHALRGRVDLLLANAPYVPTAELAALPREAREYEPRRALDGGPDGLDVHRRIAAGADRWLAPSGYLMIEIGRTQVDDARKMLADNGFGAEIARDEELGAVVMVGGRWGESRQQAGPAGQDGVPTRG